MNRYVTFCVKANKWTMAASVLFLMATVVICFVQVVTRTAISFSFRWAEELTRYIVIYAVFFASGTLLVEDEHPRVDILCGVLPKRVQLYLHYLYSLLILVFVAVLTYYGWQLAASSLKTYCSSIRIPWTVPFASVFIGGVNMLLQVPAKIMRNHQALADLAAGKKEGAA